MRQRLLRVVHGNFGDSKALGGGLFEMRFSVGPGYRIYYAMFGSKVVLLLAGGDKSSQKRDIETARGYLADWKRRERR